MPPVVIGGVVVAAKAGGGFESLYVQHLLPWLLTVWIGAGFTATWEMLHESAQIQGTSQWVVAGTGILSALVILSQLGGVAVLWEDPWIFGVAVWPGLRLAGPSFQKAVRTARPGPREPRPRG